MGKALVGYGLGNFVWYGTSELSTQTGVLLVTVDGRKVLGYRWVPARIVDGAPAAGWFRAAGRLASWHALRGCTDAEAWPQVVGEASRSLTAGTSAEGSRPEATLAPSRAWPGLAQLVAPREETGSIPKVEGSNPSRPTANHLARKG